MKEKMIGIGAGILLLFVVFIGGWHSALILPVRPIIVNEYLSPLKSEEPECDIAQVEKTQLDAYFNIRNGEDCWEYPEQIVPTCPVCHACDECLDFVHYETGLADGWENCVEVYNMNYGPCKEEYHGLREIKVYRGSKK